MPDGTNVVHLRDPIRIPPKPGRPAVFQTAASVADTVHLRRVAEMVRDDAKHSLFSDEDSETCMWLDEYMRARAEGRMDRCQSMLRLMRQGGR